jgi:hypothetical protein
MLTPSPLSRIPTLLLGYFRGGAARALQSRPIVNYVRNYSAPSLPPITAIENIILDNIKVWPGFVASAP